MKNNKDEEFTVHTNSGTRDISANIRIIGEDAIVAIWGGEKPHIGAVAMAQPRRSLQNTKRISSTASVFTYLGHKEDDLVKAVSMKLAEHTNAKVVVTAGIHWDNLSHEGIQAVLKNSEILVDLIIERLDSQS